MIKRIHSALILAVVLLSAFLMIPLAQADQKILETQCLDDRDPDNTRRRLRKCAELIQLMPPNDINLWAVHLTRCTDFQNLGRYRAAISSCQNSVSLNPNHGLAHYFMGVAYRNLREFENALEQISIYRKLVPSYYPAVYERAQILKQMGKLKEAIAQYRKFIELSPNDPRGYNSLAWLLATTHDQNLRDGKEAVSLAMYAVTLKGENPNYWDTLAAAHVTSGNSQKAIEAYRSAQKYGGKKRILADQKWLKDQGYFKGAVDGNWDHFSMDALQRCVRDGYQLHTSPTS